MFLSHCAEGMVRDPAIPAYQRGADEWHQWPAQSTGSRFPQGWDAKAPSTPDAMPSAWNWVGGCVKKHRAVPKF